MAVAAAEEPRTRIVHASPGRIRVHLASWEGRGSRSLEARLCRLRGVLSARANPLTRNVLIRFNPETTDHEGTFASVRSLGLEFDEKLEDESEPPPVQHDQRVSGARGRARIAVRGLDRNPGLARRVVERLERWPSVRASASQLTGRVLVQFDEDSVRLEDLVSEIARLESPEAPGEDRPAHPLDSGPLVKSATRAAGAAVGLGVIGLSSGQPIRASGPAVAAGVINIFEGFPVIQNGMRRLLGPNATDLIFSAAGIAFMTLSGGALGLAVSGLAALRLFTEARARREEWRRYEERAESAPSPHPGAVIRLESGERTPLAAEAIEGTGTAVGRDGLPLPVSPGEKIAAGSRLYGGPFVLELLGGEPFGPEPRSGPVGGWLDQYVGSIGLVGFAYAAATAVFTRSLARTFAALLLVNPRAAIVGAETAGAGAYARVMRSGVTVVGTRPERDVRLPGTLLFDGPRVLTDGFEVDSVLPLGEAHEASGILVRAAAVAVAAGSPWGGAFRASRGESATGGSFDGGVASATFEGVRYSLRPVEERDRVPAVARLQNRGNYSLLLFGEQEEEPLGLLALRPRLAPGVAEVVRSCRRRGVEVGLLGAGEPAAARAVAHRAEVPLLSGDDAVGVVRGKREAGGAPVAFVSDGAHAAPAFAACDLAIGLTDGRSHLPARADLLAPDLAAVAAIVEAGARRESAVRDSVLLSMAACAFGAIWGLRGPSIAQAGHPGGIAALGALATGWARLRGGERARSSFSEIADPHPERWGRRSVDNILRTFKTTESGLTSGQALERRKVTAPAARRNRFLGAILDQIRSPLTAVLAAGAGLSIFLGAPSDAVMVSAMIVANAVTGAWQERQADKTVEALERMGSSAARVLRDGGAVMVPANEVVPGDVLMLAPGDRIAADARLIEAQGLEIDEAALTGESLPVRKDPAGVADDSRVVLEGSDVIVGTGRAVVVAVGRDTRMGSIAAALAVDEAQKSPLTVRLETMLRRVLPLIALGGVIVAGSGLLWRRPLFPQLALGASVAIAAVPEGLPLLAKVGEAAVARRLSRRRALVRHLSAVEALGRVDVACTDKTGTLTEGRLRLRLVADAEREAAMPAGLPEGLRDILLTAALAGPSPDAPDNTANATDVVVNRAADEAGLGDEIRLEREGELPFDSTRSFHATIVRGRLCLEGAAEALVCRCDYVRRRGEDHPLDEAGRAELLGRARKFAERGLRVLMVAEGSTGTPLEDPRGLTALGFLGISDPLRAGVPEAVKRCHDAGVRVIMLTGDHPATARAIARDAGLSANGYEVLTGTEISELDDDERDRRLERAAVIARVTPLDKVRIVESLQRRGHTVAMTGDGVNDGPALRLADVGVAMGRGGTEVARQAADVVLADDDFSTLADTLVEGRSFWRNIRRSLSLLLGHNLGEVGLMAGASLLSPASPLTSTQVLSMNLVTDVLPALAIALQQPEHQNLAALDREGEHALEKPLRNAIIRRAIATAGPTLAAYLIALRFSGSIPAARSVAYASIVTTTLAQTLDVGRAEGGLSRSVLGAVAGSAGLFVATITAPFMRNFLGLSLLTPFGWVLVGAGTLAAVLIGRTTRSLPNPGVPFRTAPPALSVESVVRLPGRRGTSPPASLS